MKYLVTLNGKTYEVEVEHGEAMLLNEYDAAAPAAPAAPAVPAAPAATAAPAAPATPAAPAAPAAQIAEGEAVNAPMPGNIVKINVAAGDKVKSGDVLVILEAMKMENEIMAPRDGTVAQVVTAKGAKVETGSPLVVLA